MHDDLIARLRMLANAARQQPNTGSVVQTVEAAAAALEAMQAELRVYRMMTSDDFAALLVQKFLDAPIKQGVTARLR